MIKKIMLLIVCLGIVEFMVGCGKNIEKTQVEVPGMLCGFEDIKVWDVSPESGFSLNLSKDYVTEGKHSLKVVYPIDRWPSINTKRLKYNWGGFDYFCLDVFNPQEETLAFTVRLDDSTKNRVNIDCLLKRGWNKIKIPISQISQRIDVSRILYVVLFLNEPVRRYKLYFDNMRLEKELPIEIKNISKIPNSKSTTSSLKMALWAVDDSVKIKPDDSIQEQNYVWNAITKTVSIYGAKNEYVSFQLIISAGGKDISVVNIDKANLTGQSIIDKANIQLFREHYLKVTEPSTSMYGNVTLGTGEYPDPLIPIEAPKDGAPFSISKERNQPIWVDIYIPSETKGGLYQGQLIVKTKELPAQQINIQLEVWDFTLPNETHLKSFFYYGPEQIKWAHKLNTENPYDYQSLELKYQRVAHQHRMNMCTDVGSYGDWRGVLDRIGTYLNGAAFVEGAGKGVGVSLWVIGEEFNLEDKTKFQEACKWYMENFSKEGWAGKPFLYVIDEPGDKEAYDNVRKIGAWIHETSSPGNKLPFMVTEQVKPENPEFGSLVGYVDIWCSGSGFPEDMDARRQAGDRIWTYNGGPDGASVIIDTYGLACRSWAWTAWRYNIECWFLWDCAYWVDKHNLRKQEMKQTDLWNNSLTFDQRRNLKVKWADWGNGDGTFLYPGYEKGVDGPISSFRMKAFRRGMQDYEYLYLLKGLGKQQIADEAAKILDIRYNKDSQKWYEMRMKLANEIIRALKQPKE
ncbi:MAG: glycoside hydrolase domain-containing protein [Actinomycetota bacterium]